MFHDISKPLCALQGCAVSQMGAQEAELGSSRACEFCWEVSPRWDLKILCSSFLKKLFSGNTKMTKSCSAVGAVVSFCRNSGVTPDALGSERQFSSSFPKPMGCGHSSFQRTLPILCFGIGIFEMELPTKLLMDLTG